MGLKEVLIVPVNILLEMIDSIAGTVISGFVDAIIWLFHSALLKPLAQELVGVFMINENMLSTDSCEIIGLILNYCYQKMLIIGATILLLIATWQLFKNFFAYFGQTQSEEGWKIGAKLILYGILIFNAKGICTLVIRLATGIMQGIGNISVGMNQVTFSNGNIILDATGNFIGNLGSVGASIMSEMEMYTTQEWASVMGTTLKQAISKIYFVVENVKFSNSVSFSELIKSIMLILIDVKLVKLSISMAEKYMNVVLMIIISPVAFACGVSKRTSEVLKKWVSLFTSGVLYQVLQYLLLAMLYYVVNNAGDTNGFKLLLIVWSILSMAENADAIVDELGFSGLGQSASGIMSMNKVVNSMPIDYITNYSMPRFGGRSSKAGASVDLNDKSSEMKGPMIQAGEE